MNSNVPDNSRMESQPANNTGISNDIKDIFAKNSPLSLIPGLVPEQTPPVNPQKLANEIFTAKELEKLETQKAEEARVKALNGVNPEPATPQNAPTPIPQGTPTAEPVDSPPVKVEPAPVVAEETSDGSDLLDKVLDGKEDDKSVPAEGETPEGETEEDPLSDVPDVPAAENFKKLREKTKTYASRIKEIQTELQTKAQRLEEFETGAAQPDVVQELQTRITQLEPLEKIHNLKASPEYRQKFVEPLNQLGARLEEIANTYEVHPDVMHHALNMRNVKQLDAFLVEHFGNTTGALQAKEFITQAQGIQTAARQAESEPISAMQQLTAESNAAREAEENNRIATIKTNTKNAWSKTVQAIREEGVSKSLIPGDAEHNATFVTPILTAASREYGKFITALANAGLKELPQEWAEVVAKTFLLAHESAVNRARASSAEGYIFELEQNTERRTPIIRPSLTGSKGTGAVGSNKEEAPPGVRPIPIDQVGRTQMQDMGFLPKK